ncbi:methyltransferase domain-containing protein [Paenibacillus marchantiae]|uniref:class I SAM-dependent methyltransferase n=1 Tax=Paenibacillus TaxID=44249 RepID=UPI00088A4AFA|nr:MULTISPECIES: methyltransferase domain-containing protein [Paenibacillus]WDQ31139.1 methyltransferase domain-containing protein [Paenibacillus marchantiae]SDK46655.1 Phospholipid N-methyltransferase [Paenibacillus sp. OK060]
MNSNEPILFLKSFLQSPKHVGSIIPSSRFLANKMVNQAPWLEVKAVAELGSGTGAITRYIHQQAQDSTQVLLFEMNETMRNNLKTEYPSFPCYSDASRLVESMKQEGVEQLDCVFSGLPFFNFESELRNTLVDQIHKALKPEGLFIAFQYSLQMKKTLSEKFIIEKIELVPLNVPPAFVYVCRKKETI